MVIALIIPTLGILFPLSTLSDLLTPSVLRLQGLCLGWVPDDSLRPISAALLCGQRLDSNHPWRELFLNTGIIHLMVVSGAHLVFLERLLRLTLAFVPTAASRWISPVILTGFALACQLQAPITRALISYFLRRLQIKCKLFWPGHQRTLIAGLICLLLFPHWLMSMSLILSWLASVAMSWPLKASPWKALKRCALVYIILLPALATFSTPHPLSILSNWLLAPLFASILFPLTLLSVFFQSLQPLHFWAWNHFLSFLTTIEPWTSPGPSRIQLSTSALWFYILGLHLWLHFSRIISTTDRKSVV